LASFGFTVVFAVFRGVVFTFALLLVLALRVVATLAFAGALFFVVAVFDALADPRR